MKYEFTHFKTIWNNLITSWLHVIILSLHCLSYLWKQLINLLLSIPCITWLLVRPCYNFWPSNNVLYYFVWLIMFIILMLKTMYHKAMLLPSNNFITLLLMFIICIKIFNNLLLSKTWFLKIHVGFFKDHVSIDFTLRPCYNFWPSNNFITSLFTCHLYLLISIISCWCSCLVAVPNVQP